MRPEVAIDLSPLDTPSRYRGIGRYVASLAGALAELKAAGELGLDVVGLTRPWGPSRWAVDRALRYEGDPGLRPTTAQYKRYLIKRRLGQDRLASATGARLLHLTEPRGTPLGRSVPRIVTCHDLIQLVMPEDYLSSYPLEHQLQRLYDRRRYRGAARVIAISRATARDLTERLGVDPDRIDVVHHGVDHRRFKPAAEEGEIERLRQALDLRRPYLLFTGAGDKRKNLPCLVRAFARAGVAGEVELILAGSFSPAHRRAVQAAIDETRAGASVRLVGHVDEALFPALYRQALLYVFPSRYEGFGLPILEAMACGTPTITTAAASLSEVAGDAARITSPDDTEELAEAIASLIASASERAELRRRGLLQAARFTWERCARQTVASYRRALER